MPDMTPLERLAMEATWSLAELARQAGVDRGTVGRASNGEAIQPAKAQKICNALSRQLKRTIEVDDAGINLLR